MITHTMFHNDVESALLCLEDANLDCHTTTLVIHTLFTRAGIPHMSKSGQVLDHKTGARVVPHFWIRLPTGEIVDLRLRMWVGDNDTVPHGIFRQTNNDRYAYVGETASATDIYLLDDDLLDSMTDGAWKHVLHSLVSAASRSDDEVTTPFHLQKSLT